MQLRKPIDRAGAAVDLGVGIAFRAARNMEELAVVRLRSFVHSLWIRPIGNVDLCGAGWWIVGGFVEAWAFDR